MSKEPIIQSILPYIVDLNEFRRMNSGGGCASIDMTMAYDDFIVWNRLCINELTDQDLNWLLGLCRLIRKKKIGLMDMEFCIAFTAESFFYDKNKRLCIVNPR